MFRNSIGVITDTGHTFSLTFKRRRMRNGIIKALLLPTLTNETVDVIKLVLQAQK